MQTKAFKSGNSLAVRIPKDLAIFEPSQDVIIERKGDTLVLRAVERKSLADVMDIFAQFSPDFMADGRGEPDWLEAPKRDWRGANSPREQQDRAVYTVSSLPPDANAKLPEKKSGAVPLGPNVSSRHKKGK